jgi:hypothetical protein
VGEQQRLEQVDAKHQADEPAIALGGTTDRQGWPD